MPSGALWTIADLWCTGKRYSLKQKRQDRAAEPTLYNSKISFFEKKIENEKLLHCKSIFCSSLQKL